jgi:hypothetical protein
MERSPNSTEPPRACPWRRPAAGAAALLAALALAAPPSFSETRPETRSLLDSLFAGLPHAEFVWIPKEGMSDRAAMKLPVTLDGMDGWFQLDTGVDVTKVYGDLPKRRGWKRHEFAYHVPGFEIGDIDLGAVWIHDDEDMGGGEAPSGSVGLDLLFGRVVLIDYPGRRFALLDRGQVPPWMLERVSWTPANVRDGKLFINVSIAGEPVEDVVFDTGSSAFHLLLDADRWRELTGRSGPDDATIRWKARSWGHTVTAIGAPARGALVVGSARIVEPTLFYLEEQPNLFSAWPFPATGLVGNAPFWDDVVVVDLGLRPRFGLMR